MFLTASAHFFLSEWIWSMTWGSAVIPFNIVIMIFLFKIFLHINMVPAVFMAIISQLFAFVVLTGGTLISIWYLGAGGGPESFTYVPRPLYAFLFLGLLYSVFQGIFFIATKKRYQVPMSALLTIAFISNQLTILLAWLLYSIE